MKNEQYIMAIDEGTTSARAILFNSRGEEVGRAQKDISQKFPHPGWVEQDASEIFNIVETVISEVLFKTETPPYKVRSIGISNQRETTVIWDKRTGKPIYNAIVWQSKQTVDIAEKLKKAGHSDLIHSKTGLIVDSYFSATKISWILDNVPNARKQAENGDLLFGTIDTWLLWKLTDGKVHATDLTNASRTMLFNINTLKWDQELLDLFDIPHELLPQVEESSHLFGYTQDFTFMGVQIPIAGIAGDQQASLFGQLALEPGMTKNTYGTGAFIMMNLGKKPKFSSQGLLTTIAYGINGEVNYAFEGSVFVAGSAIQWLKDGIKVIESAFETEEMAKESRRDDPIYIIPAFTGLGAPYWNERIRGSILGLTAHTGKKEIARATLESLAFQTKDVINTMVEETKIPLQSLVVDGGASKNNYLMQFQADIIDNEVQRSTISETTALGAAYLAGLAVGFWKNTTELEQIKKDGQFFSPTMDENTRNRLYSNWKLAIKATEKFKVEKMD
ncbi:glycerol kinase GlpK [Fructilactobacillus vespulae]|uniref:glycerol kinase GlpK n=1 Tax=Fructilactobacillus vespulae TaxID=1249630 RepID=UPI0039B50F95